MCPAAKPEHDLRPAFVVSYDPRLPDIPDIMNKHWRAMVTMDSYLKDVFPKPPLSAFKRPTNIRELTVRAKVYHEQNSHRKRMITGMKRCNKPCPVCPYVSEGKFVKGDKFMWKIQKNFNCQSTNVIYMISCNLDRCRKQYVGETERIFTNRIQDHIGYIKNNMLTKATGHHFNSQGHSLSNMNVTIIEKVTEFDQNYRKEREHHRKFDTYYKGLNRNP